MKFLNFSSRTSSRTSAQYSLCVLTHRRTIINQSISSRTDVINFKHVNACQLQMAGSITSVLELVLELVQVLQMASSRTSVVNWL